MIMRRSLGRTFTGLCCVLVIPVLPGCASAAEQAAQPEETHISISGTGTAREDLVLVHEQDAYVSTIPAEPGALFRALVSAYDDLGIELGTVDSDARRLGNLDMRLRRRLAGEPLSRFLDCGRDMAGPYANRWRIRMSVISQVVPAAEGAELRTAVEATGTPIEGGGPRALRCTSSGVLERRIAHGAVIALGLETP